MTGIRITVSPGELLDRITILEVRLSRTQEEAQAAAVREAKNLVKVFTTAVPMNDLVNDLWDTLRAVNADIWDAEDVIRLCMKAGEFGPLFVKAAREAHAKNDERARLKAEVNRLLGAPVEEKSYGGGE